MIHLNQRQIQRTSQMMICRSERVIKYDQDHQGNS